MPIVFATPIAGTPMLTFSSPEFTIQVDTAPDNNGKQYAVTSSANAGDSTAHSASSPFTITVIRPRTFKSLGQVNPVTGILPNVPKNQWTVITRKGATPMAGQSPSLLIVRTTIDVPAGADLADPSNVKAALSAHFGFLSGHSMELGQSVILGLL